MRAAAKITFLPLPLLSEMVLQGSCPAKEVQQFVERYAAASILTKRFHLNGGSLTRHLKESGTSLPAIPIPAAGRGHGFFLRKDDAAQIQIPRRTMLSEQA